MKHYGDITKIKGNEIEPVDIITGGSPCQDLSVAGKRAGLAERITAQYDRPTTMGSLFDGIGGFPLCFMRHGCDPIWASEIEEFPIAVTKIRFPEVEECYQSKSE